MNSAQVALVTGSGRRRVGWHVAMALAERGYQLAIHYHDAAAGAAETVATLSGRGVTAQAFQADLADSAAVCQLVADVRDRFGRIDVVVNCAAIWERQRLEDVTADDLRRHFEINALATFLCGQEAGLIMVAQPEGGVIVNLSDWATARPYRDFAAYFASKGAVEAITRSLAVELAARNPRVRVNCILPGPVMLPADLPAEERARSIAGTLVKREGTPEHVAHAVLFLVENDFVTGACIPLDGGRSIHASE